MPIGNVQSGGGLHFHQYLFGIAARVDRRVHPDRLQSGARPLDERVLVLNLKDVCWQHQGRQSVIAVVIVGSAIAPLWLMRTIIGASVRNMRSKS